MERNLFRKAIIVVIIYFFIGINILPGMDGIKIKDISPKINPDLDYLKNNNEINSCLLKTMNNDDLSTKKTEKKPYENRDILLEEDFESGWNGWYPDNGVWEIGTPTAGPTGAHSGLNCAGTILNGMYPTETDSRLISPTVNLPVVGTGEEIVFRFWHWFSYAYGDYGVIEVQVFNETGGVWGDWTAVSGMFSPTSEVWTVGQVDLTSFAGEKVRISFAHYADFVYESYGWYVDDIELITPEQENNPPLFGTPSPLNSSTNNPLSLTWGISINDPEGDQFSWTIQCNNGQTNSGTEATNGTKTLALYDLAYSTTYKVWVNATDPGGSGIYTRRWYTFTTKANLPPVFGTPSPANGSTGNLLSFTWSIPINDPEGNTFSWTIQCNNGQTNSGSGATNGTKSLVLSGLAYSTTYKVWVNATDSGGSGVYTRRWYTFTTKASLPPIFGSPTPSNESTNNPLSLSWSISINDPEGDQFSWTIQCSNGQTNSGTGATNGTKTLTLANLAYATTYKVWVNATDPTGSDLFTRKWFTFTTQQQNFPPNKPNKPSGPPSGKPNTVYTYSTSTTDPNGDQVYYQWDWGDGTQSNWLGPYNSGATVSTTHTWGKGSYSIKVKAKDSNGAESNWSDPLTITMPKNSALIPYFALIQMLKQFFERFPHVFPILRHLLGY
jgi:hypothetical protein